MSSRDPEPFDLERDLPTTAEDVAALRRIREGRSFSFVEYLRYLSRLPRPAGGTRRRKTHEGLEPFEL